MFRSRLYWIVFGWLVLLKMILVPFAAFSVLLEVLDGGLSAVFAGGGWPAISGVFLIVLCPGMCGMFFLQNSELGRFVPPGIFVFMWGIAELIGTLIYAGVISYLLKGYERDVPDPAKPSPPVEY